MHDLGAGAASALRTGRCTEAWRRARPRTAHRASFGGTAAAAAAGAAVADAALRVQEIKKHPNAHMQYVDKLLSEGTMTEAEVREVHNRVQSIMQTEFDAAKDYRPAEDEWLSNVWEGFKSPAQLSRIRNTGATLA